METAKIIMDGLIILFGIVSVTMIILSFMWGKWIGKMTKEMKDDERFQDKDEINQQ